VGASLDAAAAFAFFAFFTGTAFSLGVAGGASFAAAAAAASRCRFLRRSSPIYRRRRVRRATCSSDIVRIGAHAVPYPACVRQDTHHYLPRHPPRSSLLAAYQQRPAQEPTTSSVQEVAQALKNTCATLDAHQLSTVTFTGVVSVVWRKPGRTDVFSETSARWTVGLGWRRAPVHTHAPVR
jgi:hypothetical protein